MSLTSIRIFLTVLFLSIVLINTTVLGQDNLLLYTTKVTVNAQNTPVFEILNLLERNYNLNFSYKEGLFDKNERKDLKVTNTPLNVALDSLFKSDSIFYYPLGMDVIIYEPTNILPRNIVVRDTLVQNVLQKDTVQVRVFKRDTLIVFKTDTLFDTIYVKDPYPVYDTLFMDKPGIQFMAFYSINAYNNKREFSTTLPGYPDLIYRESESNPLMQRLGLMAQINLGNTMYLKTGLGYSQASWRANYNFTSVAVDSSMISGYEIEKVPYISDSVYIDFPGSSGWVYYYEDSIIPHPQYKTDTVTQKYSGTNKLQYITIPLYVGLETKIFNNSVFFSEIGMLVDFLISTDGKTLSDSPFGELIALSELPFSPVSAYISLGFGIESPLAKQTSWFVKLNYDWQMNSDFAKTYTLSNRKRGLGLTLGVKF